MKTHCKMGRPHKYSADQYDLVLALLSVGMTDTEISKKTGVSCWSIYWIKKGYLKTRPPGNFDKAAVATRLRQIANEIEGLGGAS